MTMRKSIVKAMVGTLALVFALTGCGLGSYQEHPGEVSGSAVSGNSPDVTGKPIANQTTAPGGNPTVPSTDAPIDDTTPYTVTLYYKNKPFNPGDEKVEVVWHGETTDTIVEVGSNGEANAGVLDGDYDIYLIGLPEKYSYNPNIYRATGNSRHIDIIIVDITKPEKGDGGVNAKPEAMAIYRSGGCYVINYYGTYRVTCQKGQYFYFEYQPTSSGRYLVQSWANIYEDEVNPTVEIYTGTVGFKMYSETRDVGGPALDGGFSKNFSYEINLSAESVGSCFTFGVSAVSKTGQYPVSVDFAITYEGPYDSGSQIVKVIEATEVRGLPKARDSKEKFNYADLGTKFFNGSNYAYDGDTGLYRVYDPVKYASTNGFGPYLCCMIRKTIPCYSTTTLFDANRVGELGLNFLRLQVLDPDYPSHIVHDYEDFIRISYADKCNSDGVCYVTEELKQFLQTFAKNYTLWTDGVCPTEGTPEDKGYGANQDDLWLFACGFYEDGR